MNKIKSKQNCVTFLFCESPMTIDKSAEWGEGNVQEFPNGAFLKMGKGNKYGGGQVVTHGVQPKDDLSAPVGWIPNSEGLAGFEKEPIWVSERVEIGEVTVKTLDGIMTHDVKEPSRICYNGGEEPNMEDGWLQTEEDIRKNYFLD